MLGRLRHASALLVVDAQGVLTAIVTSHDTTEYFRLRAQDMMWVQDIEETVKEYALAAFVRADGSQDDDALRAAIEEITPSNEKELRKPFRNALLAYLRLRGEVDPKLDDKYANQAFNETIYSKGPVKQFDKLTLNEYVELLLHKSRWSRYEPIFQMETAPIKRLLDGVRATRNDLAHFRNDSISESQRAALRQCRDWLSRHEEAIDATFGTTSATMEQEGIEEEVIPKPAQMVSTGSPAGDLTKSGTPLLVVSSHKDGLTSAPFAVDAAERAGESRYAALATWLNAQPLEREQVSNTFTEIERMIGGALPASAREHRAWWGNNPKGHSQSRQWIDAGWQVSSVSMRGERVTFTRGRQERYARFFDALGTELQTVARFQFRTPPATGQTWVTVVAVPESGPKIATLAFAFARERRFRVELYIDAGDQTETKKIFDALHGKKEAIELAVGEPLAWERINERRASRIALYYPGSITDPDSRLAELRSKVVEAVPRFSEVMTKQLEAVLHPDPGAAATDG